MQTISVTINAALGSQVTWCVAESLIYYSFNLNSVLTMENSVRGIETIYFIVITAGTFGISANICSQVILTNLFAIVLYSVDSFKTDLKNSIVLGRKYIVIHKYT